MPFSEFEDFFDNLASHFRTENDVRRREELALEEGVERAEAGGTLRIESVDFQPKLNATRNNCQKFELVRGHDAKPIIRRGGTLVFDVVLTQEADLKTKQKMKVYFSFGPRPNVTKGTQAALEVSGKKMFDDSKDLWDVRVVECIGKTVTLEVKTPSDAPVGVWKPVIEVAPISAHDPNEGHLLRLETFIYLLFNPWNKEDDVYLPGEERRQEYVLNDVGKVWVGSYPTARGRHWVFGQFDDSVLPACVLLLERSGLWPESRGDPVKVSRAISRIVNSNDDQGVVVGRWDEKYEDGTAPTAWTGSIKILEQFLLKGKPVKYGQCWVFSGVVTTVCRALGIPCRSVTNLNSAHDTNLSLTIDEYYTKNGEEYKFKHGRTDPTGIDDSIWNFHVWNDVWMARPDLPTGFGGWQAIDATPQETSEGMYQCGPASLEAIRRGQVELNYDVAFLLAEVNADLIQWQEDDSSIEGFKMVSRNKTHIGKQLLTKKPGVSEAESLIEQDREDCTSEYKVMDGTGAERVYMRTAARKSRTARHAFGVPSVSEDDVDFELEDVERVPIGEDFAISVFLKNNSENKRSISAVFSAVSIYYTGVVSNEIKKAEGVFDLEPGEKETLRMKVLFSEYRDRLVEYGMIKLIAIANVQETSQAWVGCDNFQVIKPTIKIEVSGEMKVGEAANVEMSFENPLNIPLTKAVLVVDGPGISRPKTIPINEVAAKSTMTHQMKLYPKLVGTRTLVVIFNSTELVDVTGSITVIIKE